MTFSRKIFLAIFATAVASVLLLCGSFYIAISSYRLNDLKSSYEDHMHLLGLALTRVEESEGRWAQSTAQAALQLAHDHRGPWESSELLDFAKAHGVREVSLYDQNGSLLVSSGSAPASLFPVCAGLHQLLQDSHLVNQTPLLPEADGHISQDTRLASADHKYIVEVRVDASTITHLLGEMAQHDEDNEYIQILGPSRQNLGQLHRTSLPDDPSLLGQANKADGTYLENGRLLVLSTVQSQTHSCCACPSDTTKAASYRLITSISTRTYDHEVKLLALWTGVSAVILTLLSWWLSSALTGLLLRKIEVIRKVVSSITQSHDYSQRVDLPAQGDELDELGQRFNQMFSTLQEQQAKTLEAERDKARSQVAAQVAHDIRSPLMSMNMALNQIQAPPSEALSTLRSAIQRVAGIVQKLTASTLKNENVSSGVEAPKLTLMEPLLLSVVQEHQVKNPPSQQILVEGFSLVPSLWSVVQSVEMQTALSNLLNNAFEAGATQVRLVLSAENKMIQLQVIDNGRGMPTAVAEKIFERGYSSGKTGGNGLGLFQAKAAVEWAGGSLTVTSVVNHGTAFILQWPREKRPAWCPEKISIRSEQSLFFVDDDPHILQTWREKVQNLPLKSFNFFSSTDILEAEQSLQTWPSDAILFIDQNLPGSKNGLDVLAEIASYNPSLQAYLCTSEFDEKWVQDRVRSLKVGLIPKPLLAALILSVENPKE